MSHRISEKTLEPEKLRLDYIDGLRAIAALWVVGYHMWVRFLPGLTARHDLDHAWWLFPIGWCRYGHFAVDVFIVISGFCLALPVVRNGGLRGGMWAFWQKRARRILPTYYASILLTLPLCWLFVDWSRWFVTVKGVLLHVFLLQDVFNSNEISSVYWSIAVECHIYLLFPLLVYLMGRIGPAKTCLIGGSAGGTLYWALKDTPYIGCTPQYLVLFCLGMLAASHLSDGEKRKRLGVAAAILTAALWVQCGTEVVLTENQWLGTWAPLIQDAIVGLGAYCVIVAAANQSSLFAVILSARPLVWVGGFSYSLYLIHAPIHFLCLKTVWVLLQRFVPDAAAYPLFVAISLPIILAGALAFYLVFEAPFLAPGAGGVLEKFSRRVRSQSPLLRALYRLVGEGQAAELQEPPRKAA